MSVARRCTPSPQALRQLSRLAFNARPQHALHTHRCPSSQGHLTSTKRHSSSSTSSVDPNEVSHFNQLASSWWDPHGPSRLLHLMNPLRIDFIRSCLASSPHAYSTQLDYLDIGCGGGIFAESAARLPDTKSVTAIDPSSEVLAIARSHAKRDPRLQEPGRLEYLNTAIEGLSDISPGKQFDVVTLFEVIEHVSDPSQFLAIVEPYVKPGGWLVLSTIARTWASWVTTKLVAEDVLRIVPRGTHEWSKYINEPELRGWFQQRSGWEGARVMGVVYIPGVGWREAAGSEKVGNYFFGIRRAQTEL